MMQRSITSSETFQARLLRSEQWRAMLLAVVWGVVLTTMMIRRALGGVVTSVDSLFYSSAALLTFGILFQVVVFTEVRYRLRRGGGIPGWRWLVSGVIDLAIPVGVLALTQLLSPRGAYAALSGPTLLSLPMVTMLSILRLKPRASLWTGVAAALVHAGLVGNAIRLSHIETNLWPTLFTYSVLLLLTGIVASAIAAQARKYVLEAVDEAVVAEQAQRSLMSIERDLSIARDIQQGLIPSTPPAIKGFDIAGMARPAQQTGGDYYDWQGMADGRVIVALADVTGHGIGPALVMAVCRAYARASSSAATDAVALMSHVNTLIYDDLSKSGRFITMAIAILSPNGEVELVSAGHGPTLLYRAATSEVEWFGGDGMPLGVAIDELYGPHRRLRMETGDVLLLLTDGFMEWARHSDREQFGLERLRSTLSESATGSSRSIIERMDSAVFAFAGGSPQEDDTTAVAIKRI